MTPDEVVVSKILLVRPQKIGGDDPNLTSILFKWAVQPPPIYRVYVLHDPELLVVYAFAIQFGMFPVPFETSVNEWF